MESFSCPTNLILATLAGFFNLADAHPLVTVFLLFMLAISFWQILRLVRVLFRGYPPSTFINVDGLEVEPKK